MRKLVTIRTVSELRPIEGADKIELAIIDGWQCVVKKGEFVVGDLGLYFEIDSFVPAKDERFKFLEKNFTLWKNHYGARIKTIKLRGQLSQGLLLPAGLFPEVHSPIWQLKSERDYSEMLGVVKWERDTETDKPKEQKATWLGRKLKKLKYTRFKPFVLWLERSFPSLLLANATKPFPGYIPKTDEERIQNVIHKIDRSPDKFYESSIKLDGSSTTVYYNKRRFGVCSRNLDLKKDKENKYWNTVLKYDLERAMKKLKRNVALQGELMGPGIQGNREGLNEHELFIYKVWDIDQQKYLGLAERNTLYNQLEQLGATIKVVPIIGTFTLADKFPKVEDFLEFAEGPSLNAPTREGLVFTDVYTGEKGFKVIANSYLLKEDK